MINLAKRLVTEERGQAMVEYGVILALIAAVVIGTIGLIGDELSTAFDNILTELQS